MTAEHSEKTRRFSVHWLILALIIVFVVLIRVRLLDFPLERDEGEYAYMGQLILQGVPPYMNAYNMKFPGTYAMYAVIMSVFGQSIRGIHIGFMIVNCITIVLVYFLARKYLSDNAALAAGGAYALFSLSPSVLGFAAHATHFVVLPAMGGVLALLLALDKDKKIAFFCSGVLLGLAVLMKQPGLFFLLFGFFYILYAHFSALPSRPLNKLFANLGMFIAGGAAPLAITFIYLYTAGVFDRFWFWTFEYASKYGSQVAASDAFAVFRMNMSDVANGFPLLWAMSALGLITAFFYRGLKGRRAFILLFFLFSFLTICPGFYFRQHYFITLLPAVSILAGVFVQWLNDTSVNVFKKRYLGFVGIGVFILAAGAGIASQRAYLFSEDPMKLSSILYGANPFPESIEISKFIESHSAPGDRVAVFGSEPQIFFYSKRHSASGYIYVYSLMERHAYALAMQQEMAREVMSADPKFVVMVKVATSWLMRPDSEKYIFGWLQGYIRDNYSLVGVADIIPPETTVYKWYDEAKQYSVQSPYNVLIFQRNQ